MPKIRLWLWNGSRKTSQVCILIHFMIIYEEFLLVYLPKQMICGYRTSRKMGSNPKASWLNSFNQNQVCGGLNPSENCEYPIIKISYFHCRNQNKPDWFFSECFSFFPAYNTLSYLFMFVVLSLQPSRKILLASFRGQDLLFLHLYHRFV